MLTLASAASAALASTPAQTALGYWGGPGGPGGFGGHGLGFLFLLIPLFWIGVFVLIFSLVARRRRRFWAANGGHPAWGQGWAGRGGWGPQNGAAATTDAEKTLAERFAQGDIDEVEYRARLEVLRANRPTA